MNHKKVYFVGIKGVAMTALATWYKESGWRVAGSDTSEEFPTDELLKDVGIEWREGFREENIMAEMPNLVIYTGAHGGKSNIEVMAAKKLGVECLSHGEALGRATKGKRVIAVAGSHGKTTTTAMIAIILRSSGDDPSWMIGSGEIKGLGLSGHFGGGEWMVVEADEYVTDPNGDATPRFLWLKPEILVVTNIDWDHPDVYPSLAQVTHAFKKLQSQQAGEKLTIVNADDKRSDELKSGVNVLTYGKTENSDARITEVEFDRGQTRFKLRYKEEVVDLMLEIPGIHNVYNAAAAGIAAKQIGLTWEEIMMGLVQFGGAARRFELIGEKSGGVLVYDDYAHHPEEIKATLNGARKWYPNHRILAVFQPHTFTRTRALIDEFAGSFNDADEVILSDIYASAREVEVDKGLIQELVSKVQLKHRKAQYKADYPGVREYLDEVLLPGDVVIFMGAGDIYGWGKRFVSEN